MNKAKGEQKGASPLPFIIPAFGGKRAPDEESVNAPQKRVWKNDGCKSPFVFDGNKNTLYLFVLSRF